MSSLSADVPTASGRAGGRRSDRWYAVDWGTTNLRAWQLDDAGKVLRSYASDKGAGGLSRNEFEVALIALIGPDLDADGQADVFCCGMVGSKQGWVEAGYRPVPASHRPEVSDVACFEAAAGRVRVHILPGVSQDEPPDVMRGEETQIAGYFAGNKEGEVAICCPGTHSKWALADHRGIRSFKTLPTGELFALLSKQSILRHSMGTGPIVPHHFTEAVGHAVRHPERVLSELFPIRARDLLCVEPERIGNSRLSGLLIGLELANAQRFWKGRPTVIIGGGELADLYDRAIGALGAENKKLDGGDMVRTGLARARLGCIR